MTDLKFAHLTPGHPTLVGSQVCGAELAPRAPLHDATAAGEQRRIIIACRGLGYTLGTESIGEAALHR